MPVIVALDVPTVAEADGLVAAIQAEWYKIGLELIYADGGLYFTRDLIRRGRKIFLDAKLSDIPATVGRAVHNICREIEPHILSVRTALPSAIEATRGTRTKIAHVPFLTSDPPHHVKVFPTPAPAIVCAGFLAAEYRELHPDITIITPGMRLPGDDKFDDHMIPASGCPDADFLVVGRPITRAFNERAAYEKFCGLPCRR